jgi:hypothetical protein
MNQSVPGHVVKRKVNDFNLLMETWKYDFIKNVKNRFDKSSLAPVRLVFINVIIFFLLFS